jgi:hypothetical protein
MKYSTQALLMLGYKFKDTDQRDFPGNVLPYWYKFSDDQLTGQFAWLSNKFHQNRVGDIHNGAILSFADHSIAETIFNLVGRYPFAVSIDAQFKSTARIPRWIFATVTLIRPNDEVYDVEVRVSANDPMGIKILTVSGQYILPKLPKVLDDGE